MDAPMQNDYEVILYTDGACSGNPGPGGWACILVHPATERIRKMADSVGNTTSNRMEMTAVIEGLRALKRRSRVQVQYYPVVVLEGSVYAFFFGGVVVTLLDLARSATDTSWSYPSHPISEVLIVVEPEPVASPA